jgi:hypothetical protein
MYERQVGFVVGAALVTNDLEFAPRCPNLAGRFALDEFLGL